MVTLIHFYSQNLKKDMFEFTVIILVMVSQSSGGMINSVYKNLRFYGFDLLHSVFIEVPEALNVTIGMSAIFRCRHTDADFIGWSLNGTSLGRIPAPADIQVEVYSGLDGILVHVLDIRAILVYNITEVQCVAISIDPSSSELTESVMLLIQGIMIIFFVCADVV